MILLLTNYIFIHIDFHSLYIDFITPLLLVENILYLPTSYMSFAVKPMSKFHETFCDNFTEYVISSNKIITEITIEKFSK